MANPLHASASRSSRLRSRSRLGKYRSEGRLAEGSYSNVYRAYDTIEGIRVALKIPHLHLADDALHHAYLRIRRKALL